MKRDPSIHIKESDLIRIFNELGIKVPLPTVLEYAHKYSVNIRSVSITNSRMEKKLEKITKSNIGDAYLVSDIIYSVRIKLGHRGVRKIKEGDAQWATCKNLANICNQFCEDFNYEVREGYIRYINLGITRMGKDIRNVVQRLISMSENISSMESAYREMTDKGLRDMATKICEQFTFLILSRTGIKEDYTKDPLIFIWFYRLAIFLQENGWLDKYVDYLEAQFEALEFNRGIPSYKTLTSDKAIQFYSKYIYKHGEDSVSPKISGSLWDKINEEDDLPF